MNRAAQRDQAEAMTVLLMGETGSGKSTFINYCANYFLQGNIQNLKVVIPTKGHRINVSGVGSHSEADVNNSSKSQTKKCTTYEFSREGVLYKFIDTPGLSDTESTEADDRHIQLISQAAAGTESLKAIIIIINGSNSRMTVNMRNALARISGNYPDVLLNNMIVVFTNCAGNRKNFDESCLPFKSKKSFIMNNSAFSPLECSTEDEEDSLEAANLFWKQSMKKIGEIVSLIQQLAPQSTTAFRAMNEHREEIKAQIHVATSNIAMQQEFLEKLEKLKLQQEENERMIKLEEERQLHVTSDLQFRLEEIQKRGEQLKSAEQSVNSYQSRLSQTQSTINSLSTQVSQSKQALQSRRANMLSQRDCEEEETINYNKFENTSYHNTLCRNCNTLCHEKCGLDMMTGQGNSGFSQCACMNGGRCNVCGCGINTHYHFNQKIVKATSTVKKLCQSKLQEMSRQHTEASNLESSIASLEAQSAARSKEVQDINNMLNIETQKKGLTAQEIAKAEKLKQEKLAEKMQIESAIGKQKEQLSLIASQSNKTREIIDDAKRSMENSKRLVIQKSRELKGICSRFNFTQELSGVRDSLDTARRNLRNPQAERDAKAYIQQLDQLARELTEG